jgi:hypothetical protein
MSDETKILDPDEEMRLRAVRLLKATAEEGPALPGRPLGPAPSPHGFTAAKLTAALLGRCEPYPLGDDTLYVFGLSSDEQELLVEWALLRVRADLERAGEGGNGRAPQFAPGRWERQYETDVEVYQVLLSCRQGASRESPPCFSLADFPTVRRYLPYGDRQAIVRLSNSLSGSDETLGAGVRRFFGVVLTSCASFASALDGWDACPPGLKDSLTRLQLLVSRALSDGKMDSSLLSELNQV